jgi:hypothetical protein
VHPKTLLEKQMLDSDPRIKLLSKYQRKALKEYQRLLETAAINPDRILSLVEDDVGAVMPILRSMTDQVVRSAVIFEYTMIDMELDSILFRHFFGTGNKLRSRRNTHQYKTLRSMLQNLYILQKLAIIRNFKEVPRDVVSKLAAINDLRNGLAHTFFLQDLSPSKRTYKGLSILSPKGFRDFREDAWKIRCFFMPWLKKYFPDEPDSGKL